MMIISNASSFRIFWIGLAFVVSVTVLIIMDETDNDPLWFYVMESSIGLMILALMEVAYQIWSRKKKNKSSMVYLLVFDLVILWNSYFM